MSDSKDIDCYSRAEWEGYDKVVEFFNQVRDEWRHLDQVTGDQFSWDYNIEEDLFFTTVDDYDITVEKEQTNSGIIWRATHYVSSDSIQSQTTRFEKGETPEKALLQIARRVPSAVSTIESEIKREKSLADGLSDTLLDDPIS